MTSRIPSVLFVSVHNAGRSQMAAALLVPKMFQATSSVSFW
jgi:protein-tyrosine-phosphatase